jgi:hypothetical protein
MRALLAVVLALSMLLQGCLSGVVGAIDEVVPERRGVPGGLTLACLMDDAFTSMVVEIDHAPNHAPEASTVDLLLERLDEVCSKPNGITVELQETSFEALDTWTADDVRRVALDTRAAPPQDGDVLRWHILMPAGTYEDESVLGVAVNAADIAIFGDSIDDSENILRRPSAEAIENSVAVHEIGHLLGLVNAVYVSPRDHEDKDHPHHSSNDASVMYWAVESSSLGAIFSGTLPDAFDADDKADLADLQARDLEATDQLWTP